MVKADFFRMAASRPNLRQELIDDWFLFFIEKRLAFKMKNPTGVGFPSNGDQE
jgi:hypothetical protein